MPYNQGYRNTSQFASKAEYIEFMRAYATNLVDDTYTEEEIDVPISRSYGNNRALAIAIHWIEYQVGWNGGLTFAADGEYIAMHLAKKTKTAWQSPGSDPDCIDSFIRFLHVGAAGAVALEWPVIHHFPKPILIGNNKLYAGFHVKSGVATFDVFMRIAFTPRFVSDNQLMEALID